MSQVKKTYTLTVMEQGVAQASTIIEAINRQEALKIANNLKYLYKFKSFLLKVETEKDKESRYQKFSKMEAS